MKQLTNNTVNQHFVSQSEQRLNALNPGAEKKNQRTYKLRVDDRETKPPRLTLVRPTGFLIEKTLSAADLFTFHRTSGDTRRNLEDLFQRYEADVARHTLALLRKLDSDKPSDIKDELLNVFAAKLMNFVRNPHCVTKALATFGALQSHCEREREHDALLAEIRCRRPSRSVEI